MRVAFYSNYDRRGLRCEGVQESERANSPLKEKKKMPPNGTIRLFHFGEMQTICLAGSTPNPENDRPL